jgi:hypothetical protein
MRSLGLLVLLVLGVAPTASAQLPGFPPNFGCSAGNKCAVIAGTGEEVEGLDDETRGDGGPATEGAFVRVDGLDESSSGAILIADGEDGRIRRIDPDGTIHTNRDEEVDDPGGVVSTGWAPLDPIPGRHSFATLDDGLELHQVLDSTQQWQWRTTQIMDDIDASDLEASGNGYWVADRFGETVWHITFVGFPTSAWQMSPALDGLPGPRGIGDLTGGGFLVATNDDSMDCRILRHTDAGTNVLAGNQFCAGPDHSGNGDGGPATAALLRFPSDVEATADGGFVFIERERLRRVDPDGTLSTLMVTGFTNPDFPAPQPTALEVTSDGDVLVGLSRQVLRFDTNYVDATPTPTPTPTATATQTQNPLPPPPAGGGGPAVIPAKKLVATLSKAAYNVTAGKKLALKFKAASAGSYAIAIKKGKKLKKSFKGKAKAGGNTVKKKIKLKPGNYALKLTVKSGAATATDTAKLKVKKP